MTEIDKKKVFLDAIHARLEEDIQKLTEGEDERRAAIKKDARERAAAQAQNWLELQIAQIDAQESLLVEAREAANRRRLLEYRERCTEDTFAQVKERIDAFTVSPAYPGHLAQLLKKALDALGRAAPVTVVLRREDMKLAEALRAKEKGTQLDFIEGDFDLGGLRVLVPTEGKRADLSFDTSQRDLRGRFAQMSGLQVE